MTAAFRVIFEPADPPPPSVEPTVVDPCVCPLVTKSIFGARLLNCLLKNSVNPAPTPFTATNKLVPAMTITIVNKDLIFLSFNA